MYKIDQANSLILQSLQRCFLGIRVKRELPTVSVSLVSKTKNIAAQQGILESFDLIFSSSRPTFVTVKTFLKFFKLTNNYSSSICAVYLILSQNSGKVVIDPFQKFWLFESFFWQKFSGIYMKTAYIRHWLNPFIKFAALLLVIYRHNGHYLCTNKHAKLFLTVSKHFCC